MSSFFIDSKQGIQISWVELIQDLQDNPTFNTYCNSDSYYEVFKQVILSMLAGEPIYLLDPDLSENELEYLTGGSFNYDFGHTLAELPIPKTKRELVQQLRNTSKHWKITLFTSGTTGKPKPVTHSFESITRNVRFYEGEKTVIWGFAYLPAHMAGVQVFLQALLNGDSIVRLFGLEKELVLAEIETHKITHISATPTFYRLLLPLGNPLPSVVRITSGGEKFSDTVKKQLSASFPNLKFTNVYASTEAGAIFGSNGEFFTVKEDLEPLIKIEDGELHLHRSLLGHWNGNENEWYATKDLVEIIEEEPLKIRFLSRKSDLINIGGFKVNPIEVEDVLRTKAEVANARVFAKPNSVLGNILCGELVSAQPISELEIRNFLSDKLQEFKIPRIIRFVDSIETTSTGKIKRKTG